MGSTPLVSTVDQAAELLKRAGASGQQVHVVGSGSRGVPNPTDSMPLSTEALNRIVEHNPGDFTAVLEAGVPLADAQAAFAAEGQWLALDPPAGGTIGGLVATADSGPARHRYGGVRDLIIGITVVLSDGSVARAGGKVIKNVAGYDLAKLFAGSYGTLGLIASVSVRLHPLPSRNATAIATCGDPTRLAEAASALASLPLEADCLDVAWDGDRGHLLVRFGAAAADHQAESAADRMRGLGLDDARAEAEDDEIWNRQRALQRAAEGYVLKVSGRPTDLPALVAAAREQRGTVVSRAAHGLSWVALPPGADVAAVRDAVAPRPVVVLDGAAALEDAWPAPPPGTLAVMARLKERFDPARIFRPGAYVGGI